VPSKNLQEKCGSLALKYWKEAKDISIYPQASGISLKAR
jgi:hypothetical protein